MVESVQGTVNTTANTQLQYQIQDFKDGKINISKSDLKENIISLTQKGEDPSSTLLDMYESYDKIDKNDDGISYKEFETYKNSPSGILNTLGLSSKLSFDRSTIVNSITSALLNNNNQQSGLLGSGLLSGVSPSLLDNNSGMNSSNSYMNSIMQSYLQANNVNNNNTLNLANLII